MSVSVDRVNTWADQSGYGRNFTQSGEARPTLATVGGYPCVQFNGVDKWMLGQDWDALDNLDSFTVFAVLNWTVSAVITKVANDGCTDPGSVGWSAHSVAGLRLNSSSANGISQRALPDPTTKVVCSIEAISKSELHSYVDGVLSDRESGGGYVEGSGAGNIANSEPVRLGIDGAAGSCDPYGFGSLYAIRVYSPAPDATERAAIEATLAARYGITL